LTRALELFHPTAARAVTGDHVMSFVDEYLEQEFESYGISGADLLVKISSVSRRTRTGEQKTTVGWALLHALEHTAYHTGQMNILRKLWLDLKGA
jgi:uncharacterized damage-inducible protein DinB